MTPERIKRADLNKQMLIGINNNQGSNIKNYSLLRTNGVAEKIYADKLHTQPYTWMANILSAGVKEIGGQEIGVAVRNEAERSNGNFIIPQIIKNIPLSDASGMIIEIHRSAWKNLIVDQTVMCRMCGHVQQMDIDLSLLDLTDKDKALLKSKSWDEVVVELPYGWEFEGLPGIDKNDKEAGYSDYVGLIFNQFVFRIPLLGDAIKSEADVTDNILFWRKIAYDCLIQVNSVDEHGNNMGTLPMEVIHILRLSVFNTLLDKVDLAAIREALRDGIPSMPYDYLETCKSCKMKTPVTVEQGAFFSV